MPLRAVMWLVGLSGAAFGALVQPVWTHNLIGGQILAGVVAYPTDSVVPALYLTPWSVLVQLAAAGLRMGLSEWTLSVMFSALQGSLGAVALAWLAWVFSRRVVMAALVPAVALMAALATPMWVGSSLRVFHGHLYPNVFPVGPSLFAPIAMFLGLIALSLASTRRWTTAAGLIAVLPCVHIGLAVPFTIALLVMAWQDRASVEAHAKPIVFATGVGLTITALSGVLALVFHPQAPAAPEPMADVGRALAELWDDHSRIVSAGELAPLLEMAAWFGGLVWMLQTRGNDEARDEGRRLLRAVAVVTLLAAVYTIVAALAPDLVPWPVRVALITRWLNITSWVVFVGSLAALGRAALDGHRLATGALIGALVLRITGMTVGISLASQWDVVQAMPAADAWGRLARMAGLVYPLVVFGGLWASRRSRSTGGGRGLHRALVALTVVVWLRALWPMPGVGQPVGACAAPVAAARSGQGGLLVGADLWEASWVQVRTRRPLVFDPMDVNIIPFTPAAHAGVAVLLRDVYDADVRQPPPTPLDRAWSTFPPERWATIARRYHATEVLVNDRMTLPLPLQARGGGCALYRLP